MVGSVITLAGGILGALSTSRGQFIGGRVLVGAGQAFHQAVAPPLLQELAHPVSYLWVLLLIFSVSEV